MNRTMKTGPDDAVLTRCATRLAGVSPVFANTPLRTLGGDHRHVGPTFLRLGAIWAIFILYLMGLDPAGAQTLVNPSFETPTMGNFQYNPTGPGIGWTFDAGSGIEHNGSGMHAANAPDGLQAAFIQGVGTISQALNLSTGGYTLSFKAAQRNCCVSPYIQPIQVTVDGTQIGSLVSPTSQSFTTFSITFSVTSTGTHTIRFAGTDPQDKTTFIDAVALSGGLAVTTTTLASSTNPSTAGAGVTFTATVTGSAPTNGVSFKADGTTIAGCGNVGLPSGSANSKTAACTTSTLATGTHSIVATYGGDGANAGSTSPTLSQVVTTGSTIALASSTNPATAGTSIAFTATVTGNAPTGNVSFTADSTTLTGCGAVALPTGSANSKTATCSTSSLAPGTHSIVATYGGDSANNGSGATLSQAVLTTSSTTLGSSANPSTTGTGVTFTATVTGTAPTGNVGFTADGSTITGCGAVALPSGSANSKTATCSTSGLAPGLRSIVATYGGDSANSTSASSTLTQAVITTSTTTLGSSANPSPSGSSVTFTATVTGSAPTGSVGFTADGTTVTGCSAVALPSGTTNAKTATCNTSSLAIGTHSVVANYGGDTANSASSATFSEAVTGTLPVQYSYDGLGRLTGVVDLNGSAARYVYDPTGNITRIDRLATNSVAILGFEPPSGPTGTVVTISGNGFSATPAQNTVTFNGSAASVLGAGPNQLVVTVPTSATTGPIAVSAPAGSDTSVASFAVQAATATPSIQSFSPTSGTLGTSVTINGTNFASTTSGNEVKFGGVVAQQTSATASAITAVVSPGAVTGHVSVRTSSGTGTSTAIFTVPAAGHTLGDLQGGQPTVSIDGPTVSLTVNNSSGSAIGIALFEGTAGQNLGLGITGSGSTGWGSSTVTVLGPSGATLISTTLGSAWVPLPILPATGTYSIVLSPPSGVTATANVTLSSPLTGTLTLDGSAVSITSTRSGQSARYTFSGVAGKGYSILANTNVQVLGPGGWQVATTYLCGRYVPVALQTGLYTVVVGPGPFTAVSLQVLNDASGPIPYLGSDKTVTVDTIGRGSLFNLTLAATSPVDINLGSGTPVLASILDLGGGTVVPPGKVLDAGSYYVSVLPYAATNCTTGSTTIKVGAPDLYINTYSVAQNPITRTNSSSCSLYEFDVTYRVRNQNDFPLSGSSWTDRIFVANTPGGRTYQAAGANRSSITTYTTHGTISSNKPVTTGQWYVVIFVDDDQVILDTNRANNIISIPVTFNSGCG